MNKQAIKTKTGAAKRSIPPKPAASTAAKSPKARNEAELEARITRALAEAFPNIADDAIVLQRHFTVRLGHETRDLDSAALWHKTGRADILLFHDDRPLAVLEIKRDTVAITRQDYEQAQSYANMLTPRPPLVIVSNGNDTRCYEANTGAEWKPDSDAGAKVQKLLANTAKIAAADMRWAIEALLGRDLDLWPSAMRSCTARLLGDLTDPPGASGRPVARDFLFPRIATAQAAAALKTGTLFTLIDGPPAAGKTNLLRELAQDTAASDELAVLMLRGSGPGLFQSIANLFAAAFEWPLTPHDARQWMRRMSQADAGPSLVIAIDGVEPGTVMAADLHELASIEVGPKLKVILTADQREGLTRTTNGRATTGIGALGTEIELGTLGLEEFRVAQRILAEARIGFVPGAEYCQDYRAPWVLRALYDDVARDPRYGDGRSGVILSAALGLRLVDTTRETYAGQSDLLRGYRVLARDAIADNHSGVGDLAIAQSNAFVVRQDALSPESRERLAGLRAAGHVRVYRQGREDVVLPTVPAVFMVELADAAAAILEARGAADAKAAGEWLGRRLEGVYLGDLVGAQAIRTLAETTGRFSEGIVHGLFSIKPREELVEDRLIAFATPDGEIVHLKIERGKAWVSDRFGNVRGEPINMGSERSQMMGDVTGWMILGQLAQLPTARVGDDADRIDAKILFEVGQCPFPLLRANERGLGHLEHDLGDHGRVLCTEQGAIEATTQAMAEMLSRPWEGAEDFVAAVLEEGSLPLLHRLMIALRTVRGYREDRTEWASEVLRDHVAPEIKRLLKTAAKPKQATRSKPSIKRKSAKRRSRKR
ncbi:type I restriction enzyme HsdR N-terminal domain-containing protein [Sphingomonas sp. PP-CC-3A-396]|uniref:type I restriction enzyme HsdR N-terminal domain-containing protein n=1 Tax=Sphingomonas sp. PP-CC-3A-396 TaxID=2135655 RepID=UPI00104E5227|nr:type I restriction enzyme HsdR N-terminal domain-containing protein [Sphingomonas sp. PP-CC-3A-396]TCQ05733.1 type I restriction and modification enzyme subunit R-like protein [Sphingomonas sp. PP-CC-3A-396]